MADTMQFDLVSPERRLASFAAREVQIPGAEGDLTAMPDHAPLITTLRPGVLKASGPEGEKAYVVTGGFAEVTAGGASVLAERAVAVEDADEAFFAGIQTAAEEAAASAKPEVKDDADKLVADIRALRAAVGR